MSNRGNRSLANYDFPFHDYYHADETTTANSYRVGENNMGSGHDQKKLFVSKSTMIYCTEATIVYFNSSNNVAITILASTWYTFYCNIYNISHDAITEGSDLYIYCEGVLPEDVGIAEA